MYCILACQFLDNHRGAPASKLIENQISKSLLMPGFDCIASIMFPFPDNNPYHQSVSDLAALGGKRAFASFTGI
ncbi:MAG: hypothetical protein GY748_25260 [Planctomycetaceae bacterium]|nr:hypothetical protein [Planctomycetaceae bacterium]